MEPAPVQEPDWGHAWLLIKAASYASSQGHTSGTTNWGAAMSAYLRHEAKAAAQPAPVQEPCGRLESDPDEGHIFVPRIEGDWSMLGEDLYTTPPAAQRQWVGLTNEDKLHIEIMGGKSDVMLAEMVEAKLKEKNT